MSWDCFGGFLNQITTGNKRYSHLAIGCNVGLFWRICRYIFQRVPRSNYKLRLERKKVLDPNKARKKYTVTESLDVIVSVK